MYVRLKKLFTAGFCGLLWLLAFQLQVLAAPSWSLSEDATQSGNIITLTESTTCSVGAYINSVPLDTRNGFTVSFDYYISERVNGAREGLQLVFSSIPIVSDEMAYAELGYWDYIFNGNDWHPFTNFYGLEFHKGNHIATVSNASGNHKSRAEMTTYKTGILNAWHSVKAVYDTRSLTVYQDGTLLFSCPSFHPSDLSYIGFTAGTSYYEREKHQIRNISVTCPEASLVRLNANGGTCEESAVYALKNSNGTLPMPERTGYTFAGWYTLPSGGVKIEGTNYPFGAVHDVYAHWTPNTYTVNFDGCEGSPSQAQKTVTFDAAYGTLPQATRTGYQFDGWFTEKSGGTRIADAAAVSTADTHTLYAHWTIRTYKITFNPNKGKLSKSKKTRYVEYSAAIGSLPTPKRSGYTFTGWYTRKSGGTKIKTTRVIKAKATYYARWVKNSKKVTIKLNKNKGSCSKSSITVTYGGKLTGLPKATRSGYTFLGWYTKKSGGTKVTASTKTAKVVKSTKTLYAHWKKKSSGSNSSGSSSSGSTSGSTWEPFVPDCIICGGDGDCGTCGGDGLEYSYALDDNDRITCYKCGGDGDCWACGGSGKRY